MCLNIQILHFDSIDFVAYDIFFLRAQMLKKSYSETLIEQEYAHFNTMNDAQINLIEQSTMAVPPSGEGSYIHESIRAAIAEFIELGEPGLRENLSAFLQEMVQVAELVATVNNFGARG